MGCAMTIWKTKVKFRYCLSTHWPMGNLNEISGTVISEIYVLQSLDPICAKFDKFSFHGQAHMGQMGKWPWQCTATDRSESHIIAWYISNKNTWKAYMYTCFSNTVTCKVSYDILDIDQNVSVHISHRSNWPICSPTHCHVNIFHNGHTIHVLPYFFT